MLLVGYLNRNTSVVNRSALLCSSADIVALMGPLSAKSADILTIVIAGIEAHSISVC